MNGDSFDVPVTVMLPVAMWKRLGAAAQKHETSVASLVVECVRRQIVATTPTPVALRARQSGSWWSDQDEQTMRRLHAEGRSDSAIAKVLGRQQPVVSSHRRQSGLPALFRTPNTKRNSA